MPAPVGVSPRYGEGEETAGAQCGLFGSAARPTGGDETENALVALSLLEALRVLRARQFLVHDIHVCSLGGCDRTC